jgi:hypothetical protein
LTDKPPAPLYFKGHPSPDESPIKPDPNQIMITYHGNVIIIISPLDMKNNIIPLSNTDLLTILTLILIGDK